MYSNQSKQAAILTSIMKIYLNFIYSYQKGFCVNATTIFYLYFSPNLLHLSMKFRLEPSDANRSVSVV